MPNLKYLADISLYSKLNDISQLSGANNFYVITEQFNRIEVFRISAGCRAYGRSGRARSIFAERKDSER